MTSERRKRVWPWIAVAIVVVLLIPVAVLVVPILLHQGGGLSHQEPTDAWPTTVTATGDDGRERELSVFSPEPGGVVDTSALTAGDRIVVTGTGYDTSRGIYVAICAIPDDPGERPGPCLGGVPDEETDEDTAASEIQWAPSNWINDDWAWKLFGARAYDDRETGTFTAYLEIVSPVDENVDCTAVACAIYSRNDHTALGDRVQDVYIPVGFAG